MRFVDSQDVVNAWMASPTHRANIVKPQYTQIGVGIAQGMYEGQPATFVAQYFGSPLIAAAPAAQPAATAAAPPVKVTAQTEPATSSVLGTQTQAAVPVPASAPAVPAAHEATSLTQSVLRSFTRALSDPREAAGWMLGGIAALIILVLGLTMVLHIHIQPTRMLLSGAMVAGLALFFLAFNGSLLASSSSQAAGVIVAGGSNIVIDGVAAVAP